jgi:hypothetical protein
LAEVSVDRAVQPPGKRSDGGVTPGRRRLLGRVRAGTGDLFPLAPATALRRPRIWLAALAVLTAAGLNLLRQPGAGALDTVWAEDGEIFLAQAVRHGGLGAVPISYAGYYHLVPRLLTALAVAVPSGAAAAVLAVEAALCTALVALLVYTASAGHLRSTLSRVLVSAIVVVVPVAQGDVLNSVANLHWYGLYALFWVFVWTPRPRAGRVVGALTVLLVAGSDILTLAFVPLALVRALRRQRDGRRDRYGVVLAVLLALGLAAQVSGLLLGTSSRQLSPNPVRALIGYVLRAVPAPLVGQHWLGSTVDTRWIVLAGVAWLLVAAAGVLVWTRRVRPAWPLAVAAVLQSIALYVLPVLLSGVATPRYAVAPAMLVVVALVALLQPVPGAGARAAVPLAAAAPLYTLTALLALVCAVNLRTDNDRARGPDWNDGLRAARHACAAGGSTATIPIPPPAHPPWQVSVPCGYVRD